MPAPGEIYMADVPRGMSHPFLVVSRENLNRGKQVVAASITSVNVEVRSGFPNCVRIDAGNFGLARDSVIQCENLVALSVDRMNAKPIGMLDQETMRDVIRALGYVFDADCEPM
jgi:mRNA-degrading endonuclease toxin of MazEF toxin-antitoxin module